MGAQSSIDTRKYVIWLINIIIKTVQVVYIITTYSDKAFNTLLTNEKMSTLVIDER